MSENKELINELTEAQMKQVIIKFMKLLKVEVYHVELGQEEDYFTFNHITARGKRYNVILFENIMAYIKWARENKNLEKQSKNIFGYYVVLLDKHN